MFVFRQVKFPVSRSNACLLRTAERTKKAAVVADSSALVRSCAFKHNLLSTMSHHSHRETFTISATSRARVIGKGGATVKAIESFTGTHISINKPVDGLNSMVAVSISGATKHDIQCAWEQIIKQAQARGCRHSSSTLGGISDPTLESTSTAQLSTSASILHDDLPSPAEAVVPRNPISPKASWATITAKTPSLSAVPATDASSRHLRTCDNPSTDLITYLQALVGAAGGGAYSVKNTGYTVRQGLKYVPRSELQQSVAAAFTKRQEDRNADPAAAMDKSNNPFVVLPATRGSGKSTELVHFAACESYRNYVSSHQPQPSASAVVSILTYNTGMGDGSTSIGLRIVYGAMRAMRLVDNTVTWQLFCDQYGGMSITAIEAVRLLRLAFGGDQRRVLVCVDELSKAGPPNDARAMTELGQLLDTDGLCDVLVTALSLHYVDALVTGSQRRIIYIPVLPLPAEVRPLDEAVDAILNDFERPPALKKYPFYKVAFLKSIHILASGHPRTMEFLNKYLQTPGGREVILKKLRMETETSLQFLWHLCDYVNRTASSACLSLPSHYQHMYLLLTTERFHWSDVLLRTATDQSVALLSAYDVDTTKYRVSTTLAILVDLARSPSCAVSLALAAGEEGNDLAARSVKAIAALRALLGRTLADIPTLWERCRMLSTAMQVIVLADPDEATFSCITGGAVDTLALLVSRFERTEFARAGRPIPHESGVLVVAPDGNPGFDSALCGVDKDGRPAVLYEAMKVTVTTREDEPLAKIFATKLRLTLRSHFEGRVVSGVALPDEKEAESFGRIAFVLSRYADQGPPTQDEVLTQIVAERTIALDAAVVADCERAERYVNGWWETNVGFIDKSSLREQMIPTTLPVAELIAQVQFDVQQQQQQQLAESQGGESKGRKEGVAWSTIGAQ